MNLRRTECENLGVFTSHKYLRVEFKLQLFLQFSLQDRHIVLNPQDKHAMNVESI